MTMRSCYCNNKSVSIGSNRLEPSLLIVLVCLSSCCDKHHGQKQIGEEMVYFIFHPVMKGGQGRTLRQGPDDKNPSRGYEGMLFTGLLP